MDNVSRVKEAWARIEKLVASNSTHISGLNGGASDLELSALEVQIKAELPIDVKQSLKIHNGDKCLEDAKAAKSNPHSDCKVKNGVMCGLELMSVQEILSCWNRWREVEASQNTSFDSRYQSIPPGAIKLKKTHPNWIPLIADSGNNHIGIDLAPESNGDPGQVINFGRDEFVHCVLAESWAEFLELVAKDIENSCTYDFVNGTTINDPEFEDEDYYHYSDFLVKRKRHQIR